MTPERVLKALKAKGSNESRGAGSDDDGAKAG